MFSWFVDSCLVVCFFFFKQKTAYEMRISDWSSDVCSSDLHAREHALGGAQLDPGGREAAGDLDGDAGMALARHTLIGIVQAAEQRDDVGRTLVQGQAARFDAGGGVEIVEGGEQTARSEERLVGKEWGRTCRSRWSTSH